MGGGRWAAGGGMKKLGGFATEPDGRGGTSGGSIVDEVLHSPATEM